MRKLLILGLPCLALGLSSGAASAAESGARHDSGAVAVGTTTVGTTAGLDTVTVDRTTFTSNAQGVSGAAGGTEPVIRGQPIDAQLGTWHNDACRLYDRPVDVAADCSPNK